MFNFIIFHLSLDTETSSGSKSLAFWYKEIAFLVLAMRSSVSGSDSASSALPNFLRRTPWVWMYVWAKFRYSEWFSSMALWSLTHWKVFRALDFKHFKETGGKMAVPRDLIMLSIWVMQSASLSTLVRAKRQSLACHVAQKPYPHPWLQHDNHCLYWGPWDNVPRPCGDSCPATKTSCMAGELWQSWQIKQFLSIFGICTSKNNPEIVLRQWNLRYSSGRKRHRAKILIFYLFTTLQG